MKQALPYAGALFALFATVAAQADGHHAHGARLQVVPAAAPSLVLKVHSDPVAGYNLELATQKFTFAPHKAGLAHAAGEGHAHLYVDGKKVARLYGHWYHLDGLSPGRHVLRVTLNTNDHQDYTLGTQPIAAQTEISVSPK